MRDGELPDISVLGSNCLMAKEEFGTVVATEGSLPPSRPSRPVRSDLGLNPEACRSIWVKMLALATCDAQEGPYQTFHMSESGWETLRIAAWLHDCGKVTTPEYVVDKATKLETLYNRIHEVRTRFEVLKRDAQIRHLERLLHGAEAADSQRQLTQEWQELDADFAPVAQCNEGSEMLSDDKIAHHRPPAGPDNRWGFRMQVPPLLYNRGELYNLSVRKAP